MSAAPPRGRVACVQLEPVHGQPDASRAKCDALLDSTPLDGVVLIVLPEMAFTGYLFDAAARVPRDAEQTQRWCVERARRQQYWSGITFPGTNYGNAPGAFLIHPFLEASRQQRRRRRRRL